MSARTSAVAARTGPAGVDRHVLPGSEHLRILSRPEWVEAVVLFLKDKALAAGVCDARNINRLVISLSEALTNAIVHGNLEVPSAVKQRGGDAFNELVRERAADPAYAGRVVDIRVEYEADKCVWTVTDQGQGFDVGQLLARLDTMTGDEPETALSFGRGIPIMRAFVDEVAWSERGRQVRLALQLTSGAERRANPRRAFVEAVGLCCEQDRQPTDAIARNLSRSGVAIVTQRSLAPGTAVVVSLHLCRPYQRDLSGRVVRCVDLAGGFHDVAVHFDAPIDLEREIRVSEQPLTPAGSRSP